MNKPLMAFQSFFPVALAFALSVSLSAAPPDESLAVARHLQNAFSSVAEKAFPSVVIIKVRKEVRGDSAGMRISLLPPWIQKETPKEEFEGVGSGFIIREDGYIVTNHHVAGAATDLQVILHDGREFNARRVGTDWKTDLSVLKIDAKGLPALKFADSDKVKVGHWAIAIGAPYSLGYTLTSGIVSQKGRSVGLNLYEDYIQTDAAINPGNSGGPLLNIDGEVVGVNDFIVGSGSGRQGEVVGTTGLAFAIPSNLVASVADSIIENGEVVRAWIGVSLQEIDSDAKARHKVEEGVLVKGVVSGDPADKAGLEPGDLILKVGGVEVKSSKEVQFAILKYKPGQKIVFEILREGARKTLEIVAGRQRRDAVAGVEPQTSTTVAARSNIESFGVKLVESGGRLLIAGIAKGGPADGSGLLPGMRVYAVNRRKVSSVAEAERAAASNPDKLLLYVDDGVSRYFVAIGK